MSGDSDSKTSTSNPVNTGYQYGGTGGVQQTAGDDAYTDTNVKGSGTALKLDHKSSIHGGVTINSLSDDVARDAIRGSAELSNALGGYASHLSDDAIRGNTQLANSVAGYNAHVSDDAIRGNTQLANSFAGYNAHVSDDAIRGNTQLANSLAGYNAHVSDDAIQASVAAAAGSSAASRAASQSASNAAAAAAQSAAKSAGMAIDASGDALKRSLDFGDSSLHEVSASTGHSLDTVQRVVDSAMSGTRDAYSGALKLLESNAEETATAFQKAAGGQTEATQETIRKLATIAALATVGVAIFKG